MDYHIIPMRSSHLDQVEELEKNCFPEDPWSRKLFEECLAGENCQVLVAQSDAGTVFGYVVFTTLLDESDIDNIAVSREARRQGVAASLLGAAHRAGRERGASRFFLEVRPSNHAALALYQKIGYREAGRRKGYYLSPKEDAIIMRLELTDETANTDPGRTEHRL